MPRVLDAALLADLSVESTELVHFIEISDPAATPIEDGTITKLHSGLIETVEFDTLANLSEYETFGGGTWDLGGTGGRLRVQAGAGSPADPSGIAWNNVTTTFGKVTQMVMHRQVGADLNSGFPTVVAGIPGPTYADGDGYVAGMFLINSVGTTYPGGPFNEDSVLFTGTDMTTSGSSLGAELSFFVQGDGGPTHNQLWYHGDFGHFLHLYPAGLGIGEILADTEGTSDTEGRPGMFVFWSNGDDYKDDVEFKSLSVYDTPYIKFVGMPIGTFGTVRDRPAWAGVGSNFATATVTTDSGIASAWPDGSPYPYDRVTVGDGSTEAELIPAGGVWGGDIFQYTPPEPTPVLNLTTAAQDIVWDGKTWVAVHGALVFDGVKETADMSQQGMEITLPAVSVGDALDTILDHAAFLKGLLVKMWIVHLDRETGLTIDVPYLVFQGRIQSGIGISHG